MLHYSLLVYASNVLLPLRHYPIGVLFDLLGSSLELPWQLTVHFQGSLLSIFFFYHYFGSHVPFPKRGTLLHLRLRRFPGSDCPAMSHRRHSEAVLHERLKRGRVAPNHANRFVRGGNTQCRIRGLLLITVMVLTVGVLSVFCVGQLPQAR